MRKRKPPQQLFDPKDAPAVLHTLKAIVREFYQAIVFPRIEELERGYIETHNRLSKLENESFSRQALADELDRFETRLRYYRESLGEEKA